MIHLAEDVDFPVLHCDGAACLLRTQGPVRIGTEFEYCGDRGVPCDGEGGYVTARVAVWRRDDWVQEGSRCATWKGAQHVALLFYQ